MVLLYVEYINAESYRGERIAMPTGVLHRDDDRMKMEVA